jgi:hypothetical protein
MPSISVVDMHRRYRRVQSLQGKIKRRTPNDQRVSPPEEWMYDEYEEVCADLDQSLFLMRASLVSQFDSVLDTDVSIRENMLEILESLSASDFSDSFFSKLRIGTDMSSAFQTIEINILVFSGVPLRDAFEIIKRVPTLQTVISGSGTRFLTASDFVVPIVNHYQNFRNLLSKTVNLMLSRLQEIQIHQGLAILLQANKESGELLPSSIGELSMYTAHFASLQEAGRAKIDLGRDIPELS